MPSQGDETRSWRILAAPILTGVPIRTVVSRLSRSVRPGSLPVAHRPGPSLRSRPDDAPQPLRLVEAAVPAPRPRRSGTPGLLRLGLRLTQGGGGGLLRCVALRAGCSTSTAAARRSASAAWRTAFAASWACLAANSAAARAASAAAARRSTSAMACLAWDSSTTRRSRSAEAAARCPFARFAAARASTTSAARRSRSASAAALAVSAAAKAS